MLFIVTFNLYLNFLIFAEKIFQSDPNLKIPNVSDMTREERFLNSVKRSVYLQKKFFQKNSWEMASPEGVMVTR